MSETAPLLQGRPIEDSRQLLKTILPASAWLDLEMRGCVTVRGARWDYLIHPFKQTTIVNPKTDKMVAYSCIQALKPISVYSRVVGEYFLIKNHEKVYWETANVHWQYGWRSWLRSFVDSVFWDGILVPVGLVFIIIFLIFNLLNYF